MLFASETSPSLILIRDVQTLRSDELAALPLDALLAGLAELLPDGVIAQPFSRPGAGQATAAPPRHPEGNMSRDWEPNWEPMTP